MNGFARFKVRRWQVLLLLVLVMIVGMAAYSTRGKEAAVKVISPVYQDLDDTVATGGTVVPLDEFPARANWAGIVTSIDVHLGQKVRAGQLLLTMKDQYALARVENARSALEAAKVDEQYAQNNGSPEDRIAFEAERRKTEGEKQAAAAALDTLKELRKRGSVSDAELTAGEERLEAAQENLQGLEEKERERYTPQNLASLKVKVNAARAALDAEKVSYNNAYITSPINGTVFSIPVSRYDFVPMGADLLRVADLTRIRIHADFDEADIARLHTGEPVQIRWDGRPDRTWHGHVLHAPLAVTEAGPRDIGQCTIAVDDADGDLPADSHVTVNVTIATHPHALTIPREALHTHDQERFVYRVVDGKLERTPVQVGLANLFDAEVTRGLTSRDVIVLRAPQGASIENGERVSIVK